MGIWIKVDKSILRYEDVVTINSPNTYLEMAAWTLIGIGSFVFIVGFLGCCGAIKESKCMLGLVSLDKATFSRSRMRYALHSG